jgi:hypothetical protein
VNAMETKTIDRREADKFIRYTYYHRAKGQLGYQKGITSTDLAFIDQAISELPEGTEVQVWEEVETHIKDIKIY